MYNKEDLLAIVAEYDKKHGKVPTQRELRSVGVSEDPYHRVFGSYSAAQKEYAGLKEVFSGYYGPAPTPPSGVYFEEAGTPTTLVIPDAHICPGQDLSRFAKAGQLILDYLPSRIILLGDFVTLESLSGWDLAKSGNMEGKRYSEDIAAGKEALRLLLAPLKRLQEQQKFAGGSVYKPQLVFLKGNHCDRLDRYLETKPELKEHLNLVKDLQLKEIGFTDVVEYRDSIEFEGVLFTHAPQNAANQAVSGKYAIHRAAEMTAKSVVFGHTHRFEAVNYYRHGSGELTQLLMAGAFFEHTEDYAYGGLNAYYRGLVVLTHWKEGRFDVENISLERLQQMY